LIQQLRAAEPAIGLDYGMLAADIDGFQQWRSAPSVRLRWARDFTYDFRPKGGGGDDEQNHSRKGDEHYA
jgi:hypothetical protein